MEDWSKYRCWFTCAAREKHYLELKEERGSITPSEQIRLEELRTMIKKMLNRMRAT